MLPYSLHECLLQSLHFAGFTEINGGTGETTAERRTSRHEVKANNGGYEGYSISHYSNRASVPKDTRKSHGNDRFSTSLVFPSLLNCFMKNLIAVLCYAF